MEMIATKTEEDIVTLMETYVSILQLSEFDKLFMSRNQ
jgi:hypothetical protein